jgi:hypothetical protein
MIGYHGPYMMIEEDENSTQPCYCQKAKQEPRPAFEPRFVEEHHL